MSDKIQGASHNEQIARLNKIEGQIRGVQKMINKKRYCIDILLQLSAIRGGIKKVEQNILKRHLDNCFSTAIISNDEKEKKIKIDEVISLLEKIVK